MRRLVAAARLYALVVVLHARSAAAWHTPHLSLAVRATLPTPVRAVWAARTVVMQRVERGADGDEGGGGGESGPSFRQRLKGANVDAAVPNGHPTPALPQPTLTLTSTLP